MYSKIAINNVKRSLKDYTIYFFTLSLAVCIFYSFNSIESQKVIFDINNAGEEFINDITSILGLISVFVSIILGCLIVYANNFLIKKRKKELGIYMTLGMQRTKIAKILLFETIIVGVVSLVVGVLLGLIASQGVSLFTVKLFDIDIGQYKFTLSVIAIAKTVMYFSIMFILVMIFNIKTISKYKLIDMLTEQRKNKNMKTKSKLVVIAIFILSNLLLLLAYWKALNIGFRLDSSEFWIAITLGMIGTVAYFFGLGNIVSVAMQKSKKYILKISIFLLPDS